MANSVELIIGLVAPIGADIDAVERELEDFLSGIGYEVAKVRVSDWFNISSSAKAASAGYKKYCELMDAGDQLRRVTQRKDAVAGIAVGQIAKIREEMPDKKLAVVVRQLKTPEEISSLRRIYGSRFFSISCHSSRRNRVDRLTRRLAGDENEIQVNRFRAKAERLILRDEQDGKDEWGQNVRKAFPMSDLFLAVDESQVMRASLVRMLKLMFSHPYHTPTKDEHGMYQAEAAALRSSALGRQVGAVVMTRGGDIVSVGTNEVPRAGGGLYWEGDIPDKRDFTLGEDTNDLFKDKLLGEIVKRMKAARWFREKIAKMDVRQLVHSLVYNDSAVLAGAQIDNIIEFGRCVHAEMAAIVDAARRGVAVDGCELFTTTFPCHECARHIVAAGIKRVVYRVPYPKSLVKELYPDSIDVEAEHCHDTHVRFEPFVGVSPRRFRTFFEMKTRKNAQGKTVPWKGDAVQLNLGDYFSPHDLITKDEAEFILEFSDAEVGDDEAAQDRKDDQG